MRSTKPQFHAGIIYDKDFEKLKEGFFRHFTVIKAGGGLVKNKKGEILLILPPWQMGFTKRKIRRQ